MKIWGKFYEPLTDTIKDTFDILQKLKTESCLKNDEALENLIIKLLEILNDRGIIASFLMSPLSKITNPGNPTQFKLVKDSNSKRLNALLKHNTIPVTSYENLLTFRDTGKTFWIERRPFWKW